MTTEEEYESCITRLAAIIASDSNEDNGREMLRDCLDHIKEAITLTINQHYYDVVAPSWRPEIDRLIEEM